MKDRRSKWR